MTNREYLRYERFADHTNDTLTKEDPSSNGARMPHAPCTSSTNTPDELFADAVTLKTDAVLPKIDNENADGACMVLTRYKMLWDKGNGREPNNRTIVAFAENP